MRLLKPKVSEYLLGGEKIITTGCDNLLTSFLCAATNCLWKNNSLTRRLRWTLYGAGPNARVCYQKEILTENGL
jgi:hypothetical protein